MWGFFHVKMKKRINGFAVMCAVFIMMLSVVLITDDVYAADVTAGGQCLAGGYVCNGHSLGCTTCSSTGMVKCSSCNGVGYIVTTSTKDVTLNVDGSLKTFSSSKVFFGCTTCNGSGQKAYYYENNYHEGAAAHTLGSNYKTGTGKISCSTCGGDGMITSYHNSGNAMSSPSSYGCNSYLTNYYRHTAGDTYSANAAQHWKNCKYCNGTMSTTAHSFGTEYIENGYIKQKCSVCSYVKNQGKLTYTIEFNGNGATSGTTASITAIYGNSYTLTSNGYSKTGYTWKGWYLNSPYVIGGVTYTRNNINPAFYANAYVDLKAAFGYDTASLVAHYNANGRSEGRVVTAPLTDSRVLYPNKATVSNMTQEDGGTVILQAMWEANKYTVTFLPNGGKLDNPGSNLYNGINEDSVSIIFDSNSYWSMNGDIPVREGYTFLGWYTQASGGEQVYGADGKCITGGRFWSDGKKWIYPSNVTLYAHWSRNEYTVTYHGNGGISETDSVKKYYGEDIDLDYSAEKEGYIFIGWSTDPSADKGLSSMKMPDTDVELYAVYSIPVSDVREAYLMIWRSQDKDNYRVYPMECTKEMNMYYTYSLDAADVSDFLNESSYGYAVFIEDHADNITKLKETESSPEIKTYIQTVQHYKYVSGEWILFDTTWEKKFEGETFTPRYAVSPAGYHASSIDDAYVVTGDTVSRAYYLPDNYTLYFDATGGTVDPLKKQVTYGDLYGELPTPQRRGYSFLGWFNKKDAGERITSSNTYLTTGDSTLYAHWKADTYKVTYNYWKNGGVSVSKEADYVTYNALVDLNVTAEKPGWEHIGWNTDPDVEEGMSYLPMPDEDVELYAVFKKDITVTFVDQNDSGMVTRTVTRTIYNRETETDVVVFEQNEWSGWTALGWSLSDKDVNKLDAVYGGIYTAADSVILYGIYVRDVTVTYDTNGSAMNIESQTGKRYYNSSGRYVNPSFVIAGSPVLSGHSFISWSDIWGNLYNPKAQVVFTEDILLTAAWDKYPEIEAYDRYFTLDEAKSGQITEDRLLEKVKGTDKEDGILINKTAVTIIGYRASDFTNLTENADIRITYQAEDSYGNTVTKSVMIHVVDTEVKKSSKATYVRFISSLFFSDGTNLLPADKGGLEENSVWRTNPVYLSYIENALSIKKKHVETKTISAFGMEWKVEEAGSGEWEQKEETWVFEYEDIKKMKEFTNTYGFGNIKVSNGIETLLKWFGHCKQDN